MKIKDNDKKVGSNVERLCIKVGVREYISHGHVILMLFLSFHHGKYLYLACEDILVIHTHLIPLLCTCSYTGFYMGIIQLLTSMR